MRRRDFLCGSLAALAAGTLPGLSQPNAAPALPPATRLPAWPERLAGRTLRELREEYRHELFEELLPFWDKGARNRQTGALVCELNDDGTVASDEVFIWYQGRGVWLYSFLYNEFGRDQRWLEVSRQLRDFMVKTMHAGQGKWREKVRSDGTPLAEVSQEMFGWLFAAAGLIEYHRATGDKISLDLAAQSIRASVAAYDDPAYFDRHTTQYTAVELPASGVRSQGHSMVLIWMLTRLLAGHADPWLEALQRKHVDLVRHKFWNPEYGIGNEFLRHDYTRLPEAAPHMFVGHTLETLWLVMSEALRLKDRALFDTCVARIRRVLEMSWDYVFEGCGDSDYFAVGKAGQPAGPRFDVKTMWAHCEIMVACLMALAYTGEVWAKEWYERARQFTRRTMVTACPAWRQAVDRLGKDIKRAGVSTRRKDNFHQPRYLMLNLLSLDRMLASDRPPVPFPR